MCFSIQKFIEVAKEKHDKIRSGQIVALPIFEHEVCHLLGLRYYQITVNWWRHQRHLPKRQV
jgi:hypothetical protein